MRHQRRSRTRLSFPASDRSRYPTATVPAPANCVYRGGMLGKPEPPTALLLFIPFTVLPGFLWWAIPAAAVGSMLWRLRPGPIAWPFLVLCVAWPPTVVKVAAGNPVIWAVAALALGTVWRWPSVFVLLKPSLIPFALFGSWTRAGGSRSACWRRSVWSSGPSGSTGSRRS